MYYVVPVIKKQQCTAMNTKIKKTPDLKEFTV